MPRSGFGTSSPPSFLREKMFSSEEEDLSLLFFVRGYGWEDLGHGDVLQVGHDTVSNRRQEPE